MTILPTCDYCDTNIGSWPMWLGSWEARLCDECWFYLNTHSRERRAFTAVLADQREREDVT